MSGASHPLTNPRMPPRVPIFLAAGSAWQRGVNGRAPIPARPPPDPRLQLRGGTGGPVPASPGVPVPARVGAAGSCLLAVRPAAVGGVGALQGRVHLIDGGNVPDVRLPDLLRVDALAGGEDPQRGPPQAQSSGFGLRPGRAWPPATPGGASLCRGAASNRVGGRWRLHVPASTEEGAAGAALAPGHEVIAAGFGPVGTVPRLPATGRLRRGDGCCQSPPVPQLQPLQVPHLGVAGRLVLEADAGRRGSPGPRRPPTARLPTRRVTQAPAVVRGNTWPPAGLPGVGTGGRTQVSLEGCPALSGKRGRRGGRNPGRKTGWEESPPGALPRRRALLPCLKPGRREPAAMSRCPSLTSTGARGE